RPAGASVGDESLTIHGTKIAANGDVEFADFEIDAQGFEDAPADAVFERIVAEQAEMPGTTSGGDAEEDRNGQTRNSFTGKGIEVRRASRLQFGFARWFHWETTESVRHQKNDFAVR